MEQAKKDRLRALKTANLAEARARGANRPPGNGVTTVKARTRSQLAAAKAEEMGIDPFEVLLLIAKGDFGALYPDTMDSKPQKAFVPLDTRMKAAAEAAKYVYPNLKSVEQ